MENAFRRGSVPRSPKTTRTKRASSARIAVVAGDWKIARTASHVRSAGADAGAKTSAKLAKAGTTASHTSGRRG